MDRQLRFLLIMFGLLLMFILLGGSVGGWVGIIIGSIMSLFFLPIIKDAMEMFDD